MNLDKALRAMQQTEAWTNSVQAACLFANKSYGPEVLAAMTEKFLDRLTYENSEVGVPDDIGPDLVEAVREWEPPLTDPAGSEPTLARIESAVAGLTGVLLEDTGRGMGKPWQQPVGAYDAYPKDWVVLDSSKEWVSLISGNVHAPSVSGWRELAPESVRPQWVQPSGAHGSYGLGAEVIHEDKFWRSNVAGNVWVPGVYGWTEISD